MLIVFGEIGTPLSDLKEKIRKEFSIRPPSRSVRQTKEQTSERDQKDEENGIVDEEREGLMLDWSLLEEECWWSHYLPHSLRSTISTQNYKDVFTQERQQFQESVESTRQRVQKLKEWIRSQPFKKVAIVAHSSFLREFMGADKKIPNCHIEHMTL